MYHLSDLLTIPLPYAVGIMEMLWHYASVNTPRGDIGSQPDEAIKQACCFARKAHYLVEALSAARWIDPDPEHRYILHDWPDHCEGAVVKLLEHRKHDFLPVYGKSLDSRKRISRDSPASREAKAKAGVDFEFDFKKENVESSVGKIDGQPLFERLIGAFMAAGVMLSEQRLRDAGFAWVSLADSDWEPATQLAESKAKTTDAKHMGWPANFLKNGDWRGIGPGRILPPAREPTKSEQSTAEALRMVQKGRSF